MTIVSAQTLVTTFVVGDQHTVTATCPAGFLVGGGQRLMFSQANDRNRALATESYPSGATSWTVAASVVAGAWGAGGPTLTVQAYAICAQ